MSTPKAKSIILLDIANSIYNAIPDSSIIYCEQAEKLSRKHHLKVEYALALNCEARYLLLKGDLKNSLQKLNETIPIFEKHGERKGLAKSYLLKAIAVDRLNRHKESIEYLLRAKKLYRSIKYNDGLVGVLTNLSNTYCKVNEYQKALDALRELDKLNYTQDGNQLSKENSYGNIY